MSGVAEFAAAKGVTRLCHLTPLRNLVHIARGHGLLSTVELGEDRGVYNAQDLLRLDGYPDHICCSVEYPNVWYLKTRRRYPAPLQALFPNWVCLAIDPSHLGRTDTLLCHRNAAAGAGRFVTSGVQGIQAMYAPSVIGSYGNTWTRGRKPASCPTDDQAEVLIAKRIPLADASTVIVADEAQARDAYVALELAQADVRAFEWVIAPELFQTGMSDKLRRGARPVERPWTMGLPDGR
jgi:hypothetical protein